MRSKTSGDPEKGFFAIEKRKEADYKKLREKKGCRNRYKSKEKAERR